MLDINVLNLYDETTNTIREVVPLEDVFAALERQRIEFMETLGLSEKERLEIEEAYFQ